MQSALTKNLLSQLSPSQKNSLKKTYAILFKIVSKPLYIYGRLIKTPLSLINNQKKKERKLEIGPGNTRIAGFETVNVVWGSNVDYIADASKKLPFKDNTFDIVYASHILEHIPWYQLEKTLTEWFRIVKPGGSIEIWIPDGLLIAKTFVEYEETGVDNIINDGWYKFNEEKDPCIWANGRIFSYGDGTGIKSNPNWHLSIFSPRYLEKILSKSGFVKIERLKKENVRGYDHGWINLGMRGYKP